MKKLVAAIVMVQLIGISPAFAQEDVPSQYINIEEMLVEAGRMSPDMFLQDRTMKPKFKRLLRLKRSMLPKLRETAESKALD